MPILPLSRPYANIRGEPVLDRVDTAIFTARYFRQCLDCGFCEDVCCSYGAQLDAANAGRILAGGSELEAYIGVPKAEWFHSVPSDDPLDPDTPMLRTQVRNGRCVFLNRQGRGCKLHSFQLERDRDVNAIKPMVCALFPVTYDYGLLRNAYEVNTRELVCLDQGLDQGDTAYQGAREDLRYYFGAELVAELDRLEAELQPKPGAKHQADMLG